MCLNSSMDVASNVQMSYSKFYNKVTKFPSFRVKTGIKFVIALRSRFVPSGGYT